MIRSGLLMTQLPRPWSMEQHWQEKRRQDMTCQHLCSFTTPPHCCSTVRARDSKSFNCWMEAGHLSLWILTDKNPCKTFGCVQKSLYTVSTKAFLSYFNSKKIDLCNSAAMWNFSPSGRLCWMCISVHKMRCLICQQLQRDDKRTKMGQK